MVYIYDILLNFCDNDVIYDFYEWMKTDNIENIKRIRMIKITKNEYNDMLKYNVKVDSNFLEKIYRTCEIYSNKSTKKLDYSILISDGERVLAVEFNKQGETIYKSKLMLEEEEEIAILANNLELYPLTYEKKEFTLKERFITRNEIKIQKYLLKEIENSYKEKNYKKLKFLYDEYFDKKNKSYEKMYIELTESLKKEINQKHFDIYQLLKITTQKKEV